MSRPSQNRPLATISATMRLLYFTCMKKRMTRLALVPAISMAITTFTTWLPKSMRAASFVTKVRTMSATKTLKYVRSVGCSVCSCSCSAMSVPRPRIDEVEQREQEDPDDVDEMPVEPDELHRRVVRLAEGAAIGAGGDDQQHRNTDD